MLTIKYSNKVEMLPIKYNDVLIYIGVETLNSSSWMLSVQVPLVIVLSTARWNRVQVADDSA